MLQNTMKTCRGCNKLLPIEMFGKHSRYKDKCRSRCNECRNQEGKEYYAKNKEYYRKKSKQYREQNPERVRQRWKHIYEQNKEHYKQQNKQYRENNRFLYWKIGAKRRNIPFELTKEDIDAMPMVCHYTGQPLTNEINKPTTVSIDRIDSSKGYTKDNVTLCCAFVNAMKSDLTYEQFLYVCKVIAELHRDKIEAMIHNVRNN